MIKLTVMLIIIGVMAGQAKAEEPNWEQIVPIIAQIESGGNPNAYNKESGAIGLMQITDIVLREYNKWSMKSYTVAYENGFLVEPIVYKTQDLFNPEINKQIGTWYLNRIWRHYLPYYKLEQSIENLLIAYNFGIGNLVKYRQGKIKLPKETKDYLLKYKALEKKGR